MREMTTGMDEIVLSADQLLLLQSRAVFFQAIHNHSGSGEYVISKEDVLLPCPDQASWQSISKVIQLLVRPPQTSFLDEELNVVHAFRLGIYIQSDYLINVLMKHYVTISNCVELLIELLNLVGPTDYTSVRILEFIEQEVGLSHQRAIAVKYTRRRLSKMMRNYKHRNWQFWRHYPSNMTCLYCHESIPVNSITTGAAACIQMAPCCASLMHVDCQTKHMTAHTHPTCPFCGTYFETNSTVDNDSDMLHFIFKRLQHRDAYNVPRCYPHHHKTCYEYVGMPHIKVGYNYFVI